MKDKPIIGILSNYTMDDGIGLCISIGADGQEWQVLADDYIKSVELAGGCPVIIPIVENIESVLPIIRLMDGVIFTGGSDINPAHYGEYPIQELGGVCPHRDDHEISLVHFIISKMDIPVLGICRGTQLLTAAFGGTLYQDLPSQNKGAFKHSGLNFPRHYPSHEVSIKPDTKLYSIFKCERIQVNSFHHQSVKTLGKDFEASMMADDGVIEGIEMKGDRFVAAVQWHPEMMAAVDRGHLVIFEEFINLCRK